MIVNRLVKLSGFLVRLLGGTVGRTFSLQTVRILLGALLSCLFVLCRDSTKESMRLLMMNMTKEGWGLYVLFMVGFSWLGGHLLMGLQSYDMSLIGRPRTQVYQTILELCLGFLSGLTGNNLWMIGLVCGTNAKVGYLVATVIGLFVWMVSTLPSTTFLHSHFRGQSATDGDLTSRRRVS